MEGRTRGSRGWGALALFIYKRLCVHGLGDFMLRPAAVIAAVAAAFWFAGPARGQTLAAWQMDPPRMNMATRDVAGNAGAPAPHAASGAAAPMTAAAAGGMMSTPTAHAAAVEAGAGSVPSSPIAGTEQLSLEAPAVTSVALPMAGPPMPAHLPPTRAMAQPAFKVVPANVAMTTSAAMPEAAAVILPAGATATTGGDRAAAMSKTAAAATSAPVPAPTSTPTPAPAQTKPLAAEPAAAPSATSGASAGAKAATGDTETTLENQPIRAASPAGDASKATVTEPAPHKSMFGGSTVQVIAALAIVLGLVLIGKAVFVRVAPGARASGGRGVMEILARYPIGNKQTLLMVRVGSQIVVLCQSGQGSQAVLTISDQTEVARVIGQVQGQQWNSIQGGFQTLMASAQKDLEAGLEEDDAPALGSGGERRSGPVRTTLTHAFREAEEHETQAPAVNAQAMEDEMDEMAAARRQLLELRKKVQAISNTIG